MIVIRDPEEIQGKIKNAVITIGNFDGVHLGHREIFRRVRSEATRTGGNSVVVTFTPHPLKLFPDRKQLLLITTYEEKEGLIASSGIDFLISIPFTREFAALSPNAFVSEYLMDRIGMKKLIIGHDYAFGRNREGTVDLLLGLQEKLGFSLEVLPAIGDASRVYSSTGIRNLIGAGEVREVVSLLGRHHFIDGTVVHGDRRGREIGFPTANIATENELVPPYGVYAVKVRVDGEEYGGACNVGVKPTFQVGVASIEVFLIDFSGDLYGRKMRIFFLDRIRPEKRFQNVQQLLEAIGDDVEKCRKVILETEVIEYTASPRKKE